MYVKHVLMHADIIQCKRAKTCMYYTTGKLHTILCYYFIPILVPLVWVFGRATE